MPLDAVFAITNEYTGAVVENPATKVLREERTVGLPNDTVLTAKDGRVIPVGDSSAPIRDLGGKITGVVLVFSRSDGAQEGRRNTDQSGFDSRVVRGCHHWRTPWMARLPAGTWQPLEFSVIPPAKCWDPVSLRSFRIVRPTIVSSFLARIRRDEHIRQFRNCTPAGKAGAEITVALTIFLPIRDGAGRIVGASTIARDVSGLKRIQLQLLHAQKLECLGVLAGGVAHDFNNYLMAITANASLIQDEVPCRVRRGPFG